MDEKSLEARLHEIVDRMVGTRNMNALALVIPPFDISRPNFHDSKPEFLAELSVVDGSLERIEGLIDLLSPKKEDDPAAHVFDNIRKAVDQGALKRSASIELSTLHDLVRKNIADVGLLFSFLFSLLDVRRELMERRKELATQEEHFWSGKSRPPNYYARTIALRLARLYANRKGEIPTFGTSRDGGHPSTSYGRALEEVFAVLEISAKPRGPAKWAISQISDVDIQASSTETLGSILGLSEYRNYPQELSENRAGLLGEMLKGLRK